METTEELKPQKPKKKSKLIIGAVLMLGAVAVLSACTSSFCSEGDLSRIMKAYEPGVLEFHDVETPAEGVTATPLVGTPLYYTVKKNGTLNSVDSQVINAGYYIPTDEYWVKIDIFTLEEAHKRYIIWFDEVGSEEDKKDLVRFEYPEINKERADFLMEYFGYVKFLGFDAEGNEARWVNFDLWNSRLRSEMPLGSTPDATYLNVYKNSIDTYTNANRSCIALSTSKFGHYIPVGEELPAGADADAGKVYISAKSWGYAWKRGFLEGLIVYPVASLIELFSTGFGGGGWGQVGAIILVTLIVRLVLQGLTFWATRSQIRMQAVQPEVQRIQAKYPNSKENPQERQRMAQEQQQLYKKHKVKMWMPFVQMFIQFPIFISVWGAMNGSASLSSDALFGLRLSAEMSGTLFSSLVGTGGWWTALVLFIIMAVSQVGSMLLPNLLTKKRNKMVTNKLGPQPKQRGMGNMMSIIMGVMIIVMGLFLPAAMTIYWIVGALISALTTVVTHFLTVRAMQNLGKKKPLKTAKRARIKK